RGITLGVRTRPGAGHSAQLAGNTALPRSTAAASDRCGEGGGGNVRRKRSMRSIAGKRNSRATVPSPSAELITTSRTELFKPSQCSGPCGRIRSRESRFHTASMSLLPMVPSSARCSMPNLTGLKGSIRPGPQAGRRFAQAKASPCSNRRLRYKRDEDKPIGDLVEPGRPHLGGHRRNQVIGGETIVCRTAREKTQIA